RGIAPAARSVGYMANGSFHGELLSVRETKPISLTHQRRRDTELKQKGIHRRGFRKTYLALPLRLCVSAVQFPFTAVLSLCEFYEPA
ncbi:MAG TPA: hypothetical protein VHY37_11845, partial [Tepidisphaeraceae bacterium]|nr:hypothetical protein [Tepidisphaeraceae bacterium]